MTRRRQLTQATTDNYPERNHGDGADLPAGDRDTFDGRHGAPGNLVAPAGAARGCDHLARLWRAWRRLLARGRGAGVSARARCDRGRLSRARPQPRPAGRGASLRGLTDDLLERGQLGGAPGTRSAAVRAGSFQRRPGRLAGRTAGSGLDRRPGRLEPGASAGRNRPCRQADGRPFAWQVRTVDHLEG